MTLGRRPPPAAGKNKKVVKKKFAKQDFDFLYDEKKGALQWNGSDKGFGDGIIVILKDVPDLTSSNLEFIWDKSLSYLFTNNHGNYHQATTPATP